FNSSRNLRPFVSIIILEPYHLNKKFISCIKSYSSQEYQNYEIVLVLWRRKFDPDIKDLFLKNKISLKQINFVNIQGNPGYAKGNNVGVKNAKAEYVLISNPDVNVQSKFLTQLVGSYFFLQNYVKSDKIIVGPRICNNDGIIEYSRRKINFLGFSNIDISKTEKIRRTMISSGCSFYIKKKYYEELNGFDERYFMYKDDIDFSIRASKLGIKQYVDNSIHLYHLRSDNDYKLNNFKYYFHERNRLILSIEHSTKKKKMIFINLLYEPLHIIFALSNGFFKTRIKIYKYLIQNFHSIIGSKFKENRYFDQYYKMDGIFNEVNTNTLSFRFLNYFTKILFYFYHH
ncbi:MAG: glycosyltransferase family 2 protein, partial [Candidatus Lokiarchaeia archaeon]